MDPDWFYTRCATIARRVHIHPGAGVAGFCKVFGCGADLDLKSGNESRTKKEAKAVELIFCLTLLLTIFLGHLSLCSVPPSAIVSLPLWSPGLFLVRPWGMPHFFAFPWILGNFFFPSLFFLGPSFFGSLLIWGSAFWVFLFF